MIDVGHFDHDRDMVKRGTKYADDALSIIPEEKLTAAHYYNAANGYLALWQMCRNVSFEEGRIDHAHPRSLHLFRKALDLAENKPAGVERGLYKQLLVNFGNCLDTVGRSVEAISYYDRVIKIDPAMGEALGNKAVTLYHLASLAKGFTHRFLLEAERLLGESVEQPLHTNTAQNFSAYLDNLTSWMKAHGEVRPEQMPSSPAVSEFDEFHREFCIRHQLYLIPTTLLGEKDSIIGDPMFISRMVAPIEDNEKFDRFITFLNQIKQDFVLARYLLVASRYRSTDIDEMDRHVTLYYPLDYSVHSTYIQMMKASVRLAVDLLDKIAVFIRDYCDVQDLRIDRTNFRNVWATQNESLRLRANVAAKGNWFLYALFSLSRDLARGGDLEKIYDLRNALTHRFMVVHDIVIDNSANPDLPRMNVEVLFREAISAMQIARAAVMYLILMVDLEEGRQAKGGPFAPIPGTPVDDLFRWVPSQGD
jgi:tetratricopeptide (TPR) repeat protein